MSKYIFIIFFFIIFNYIKYINKIIKIEKEIDIFISIYFLSFIKSLILLI